MRVIDKAVEHYIVTECAPAIRPRGLRITMYHSLETEEDIARYYALTLRWGVLLGGCCAKAKWN